VPATGPLSHIPLSQAVRDGDTIYVSGQIGADSTGALVSGGVGAETEMVLSNLKAHLAALSASMTDIVKTTAYLVDFADYAEFNEVYGRTFQSNHPARATIGVRELPFGARVEIEAIAVVAP
jgi:2-iminobutanoate/2-iminopropanoate deaminase